MAKSKKKTVALCAWCKKIVIIDGKEVLLSDTRLKASEIESHGICWKCAEEMQASYKRVKATGNPPVFVVDKPIWTEAQALVQKGYKGKRQPKEFYAVVTDVYKKLGGKINRVARGNPSPKEWDAVISMFKKFHDFMPGGVDVIEVKTRTIPKALAAIGHVESIAYRSYKWTGHVETYFHKFKIADRPILATDADGKQLYIIGGSYRVKGEGIVG